MQSPFCSLTTGFGNKDRDFEFVFLVIIDFQAGEEVQWCPSELSIAIEIHQERRQLGEEGVNFPHPPK